MSSVEHAKHELLNYARTHDAERHERLRPMKAALITAGVIILASRVLGRVGRAPRGGLVGGLVALRLAMKYGPALAEGFRHARRAYQAAVAHNGTVRPVPTRPGLPVIVASAGEASAQPQPSGAA